MAPRGDDLLNAKLIPDAGKIVMDEGKPWGRGIVSDIKTTIGSHWRTEMTNINQKTIAVTFLVFITVIAPTLTFGAVYGKVTNNNIGVIETILAKSWVGIIYSLIGGMPICINGASGPVLVFTSVLYTMSQNLDVPFLPMYAWCSVWICIYALLAGFFDVMRVVRLATRFTDEVSALMVVSIFLMDAIGDPFSDVGILRYFDPNHPSHEKLDEEDPDYNYLATALLSTLLGLGTTWLIFFLRGVKFSSFFRSDTMRNSIHDFAVILSVVIFTLAKFYFFPSIATEELVVPECFEPSFKCCDSTCKTLWPDNCPYRSEPYGTRRWFINMLDLNGKGYIPFLAAGPAFLAFPLILNNGFTWHLIYDKSHNLQHGEAYNYDICLIGLFNLVNGLLGLPWMVANTVTCVIHLNSLADKDRDGNFLYVHETRLCNLFSHLMVAMSILVLNLLRLLPLPVLYGVFLFMGLSSLPNIQFWNRLLLFFQQEDRWSDTPYTKYVDSSKIHKYTVFQILFFGLAFLVQNLRKIAIVFPMMTFLCIPARIYLMPNFLEGWEILLLDGDHEEIDEWVEVKEAATGIEAMFWKEGCDPDTENCSDDEEEEIEFFKVRCDPDTEFSSDDEEDGGYWKVDCDPDIIYSSDDNEQEEENK